MTDFLLNLKDSWESTGEALRKLRLFQPCDLRRSTCSLVDPKSMGLPLVETALSALGVTAAHFQDPTDHQRALEQNQLWVWQEVPHDKKGNSGEQSQRAASSLERLLGNVEGSEAAEQRLALEIYEHFFGDKSLLLNDHLEAGWSSVADMAKESRFREAFLGDEGDLQQAIAHDHAWTLVDLEDSKISVAAASLQGLLAKAWLNHPAVIRAQRAQHLEASFPQVSKDSPKRAGPRF